MLNKFSVKWLCIWFVTSLTWFVTCPNTALYNLVRPGRTYLHNLMMFLYYSFHPHNCIHSTEFSSALCKVHSSPALLQLPRFPTDPVPCFPDCWAFCHQYFTQAFQFGSVPVQVQLCVFLQLMKHFWPAFIQRHVWAQHRVKAEIHVWW